MLVGVSILSALILIVQVRENENFNWLQLYEHTLYQQDASIMQALTRLLTYS